MATQLWWQELFAIIDTRQTQAFARLLCEDASFRYGSNADVRGRAAIGGIINFRLLQH